MYVYRYIYMYSRNTRQLDKKRRYGNHLTDPLNRKDTGCISSFSSKKVQFYL